MSLDDTSRRLDHVQPGQKQSDLACLYGNLMAEPDAISSNPHPRAGHAGVRAGVAPWPSSSRASSRAATAPPATCTASRSAARSRAHPSSPGGPAVLGLLDAYAGKAVIPPPVGPQRTLRLDDPEAVLHAGAL